MNQEFIAQREYRLASLPPLSDPPTAAQLQQREDCLTRFYADWQISNKEKQTKWVTEWWREVWTGLRTQMKVSVAGKLWRS
jgi:hypothetical protein